MIKILITQEGEPTLITPCLCCGSLKFVHQVLLQSLTSNHPCLQRLLVFISSLSSMPHPRHQECLQRWIKSSDIKRCELCKFPFVMQSKVIHYHHLAFLMIIIFNPYLIINMIIDQLDLDQITVITVSNVLILQCLVCKFCKSNPYRQWIKMI